MVSKTISYSDKNDHRHYWTVGKHWNETYIQKMLDQLKVGWPQINYSIAEIPPNKCCEIHGAK